MKPGSFTASLIALLGLTFSVRASAQTDHYIASTHHNPSATASINAYAAPATPAVSAAVEDGFARRYPRAINAKWTKLEKGFQASFLESGQKTTAVFSEWGKFSYAITELDAAQIPAEVSAFIQKEYPGHNLIQALSIRAGHQTVYQTTLQHGTNYVKIKSTGEDMEVSILQNRPIVQ